MAREDTTPSERGVLATAFWTAMEARLAEPKFAELADKPGFGEAVSEKTGKLLKHVSDGVYDTMMTSLAATVSANHELRRNFESTVERVWGKPLDLLYAFYGICQEVGQEFQLTLQFPDHLDDYWTNWLRHGLTMASRSQQFTQRRDDGSEVQLSLLTLAAQVIEHEAALHPDTDDADAILTSLAQFDFLSNLAAIDGAGDTDGKVFYTNWARFRQERIQPIADRLVSDPALRQGIFRDHDDRELARALVEVGKMARSEGIRYDGFWGWHTGTPVGDFITANSPPVA